MSVFGASLLARKILTLVVADRVDYSSPIPSLYPSLYHPPRKKENMTFITCPLTRIIKRLKECGMSAGIHAGRISK